MPRLEARRLSVEVELIVLDKDGTIVDVNSPWAAVGIEWAERVATDLGDLGARNGLIDLMGVIEADLTVVADGPMAVMSVEEMFDFLVAELAPLAGGRAAAEELVLPFPDVVFDETTVLPIGDVAGSVSRLAAAGFRFAIATNAGRWSTDRSLEILGIGDHIEAINSADDSTARKPSPEVLADIATQTGVAPDRMVMVGDSRNDIATGHNGGAAATVGVAADPDDTARLDGFADAVVTSLDELRCP